MATFIALYQGPNVSSAQMVAVTAEPELVAYVAGRVLRDSTEKDSETDDPVLKALNSGRRRALRLITCGRSQ